MGLIEPKLPWVCVFGMKKRCVYKTVECKYMKKKKQRNEHAKNKNNTKKYVFDILFISVTTQSLIHGCTALWHKHLSAVVYKLLHSLAHSRRLLLG